jgi:hypothetical protein
VRDYSSVIFKQLLSATGLDQPRRNTPNISAHSM